MAAHIDEEQLFSSLLLFDKIAVAVSGGSDSLALLLLLSAWASKNNKELRVLTVDHGLRQEAAFEAAQVALICDRLNIVHQILNWAGDKPVTGLAKSARAARYDLMAQDCHSHGISALVLGHTLDDQAETVFMRLQRANDKEGGFSGRGLSGMAERTLFSPFPPVELWLFRPLLAITRNCLRDYLIVGKVPWCDDPTNENRDYERVRTRQTLIKAPRLSRDLISFSNIIARMRRHVAKQAAQFIECYCEASVCDVVTIDRQAFELLPKSVCVVVMQMLLSITGGRAYLPSADKVGDLLKAQKSTTLARVHVSWCADVVTLCREIRNLPSLQPITGDTILWDNRFWLRLKEDISAPAYILSYNDNKDVQEDMPDICFDNDAHGLVAVNRKALKAMPMVQIPDDKYSQGNVVLHYGGSNNVVSITRSYGAVDRYCPDFDLSIRSAVKRLFTVKMIKR